MPQDERPVRYRKIRAWDGLISNRDPHDAPEAFVSGQNMRTHIPGLLVPRKGCAPVTFTNEDTATTNDCIAIFGVRNEVQGDMVLWLDSAGNLNVGKGAS